MCTLRQAPWFPTVAALRGAPHRPSSQVCCLHPSNNRLPFQREKKRRYDWLELRDFTGPCLTRGCVHLAPKVTCMSCIFHAHCIHMYGASVYVWPVRSAEKGETISSWAEQSCYSVRRGWSWTSLSLHIHQNLGGEDLLEKSRIQLFLPTLTTIIQ